MITDSALVVVLEAGGSGPTCRILIVFDAMGGVACVAVRILVVEDNRQLADWLAKTLRRDSYCVDCVYDGATASHVLTYENYGLVILDLGLPLQDGLAILRELRAGGNRVPVIILTAIDTVSSRVAGLDAGADDYLTKPFDMIELEARIRVQLRRSNQLVQSIVRCGQLAFDINARRFTLRGMALDLRAREHSVLEALVLRAGCTVSKSALAMSVFGVHEETNPNALEIYVHRVRKKLVGADVTITTLRGLGYALTAEATESSFLTAL